MAALPLEPPFYANELKKLFGKIISLCVYVLVVKLEFQKLSFTKRKACS